MKKIFSILVTISVAFAMVSCGGDSSSNHPDIPSVDKSVSYIYELLMPAGSSTTMSKTITLDDFEGIKEHKNDISKIKVRSSSKIVITGIDKNEHKIENLTLRVKGTDIAKEFANKGDLVKDGVFNFLEDQEFMQKIMDKLSAKKSITLELFCGNTEKEINKEVKLELDLDLQFEF